MQPAIAITITVLMGLVPVFVPFQVSNSARKLNFNPSKRTRVVIIAFALLAGWFGFVMWGALSGFFLTSAIRIRGVPLPQLSYLSLGPVIIGGLLIAYSSTTRAVLDTWRPQWVILMQTTRIIGGVFLLRYLTGDMPGVFALPAGIGDVIIGVTAPIMAYLVATRGDKVRGLAIAWNILGILDLVNALTLGFLTFGLRVFPGAQFTAAGQPTAFPLVLIPGFGVPLTILVHIVTLRLLFRQRENTAQPASE